ncbi:Uncharacterized protein TCM_041190 [Theobroma cacao]|uniref:RNase H type-1 domain-containing protein n=1 Tax=Theobroma cacao TaxID=3641 RepID=A0A061GV16_THECC|nr:Uncharacterized protein TCM_041190 [Theobroma cacao]
MSIGQRKGRKKGEKEIWKCRNNLIFKQKDECTSRLWLRDRQIAREIGAIMEWKSNGCRINKWIIMWKPPDPGHFSLNTDGAFEFGSGHASVKGLIRNIDGEWVHGFVVNIGITDSLAAKLLGIREGLLLAKRLQIQPFVVELDATMVVKFLT